LIAALALCGRARPFFGAAASALRHLFRQSLRLGAIQILLASLGALDTVVIQAIGTHARDVSSYDVAALLGRIPLFLSGAIAVVFYQSMARARTDRECSVGLQSAMRLYLLAVGPFTILLANMPITLLR